MSDNLAELMEKYEAAKAKTAEAEKAAMKQREDEARRGRLNANDSRWREFHTRYVNTALDEQELARELVAALTTWRDPATAPIGERVIALLRGSFGKKTFRQRVTIMVRDNGFWDGEDREYIDGGWNVVGWMPLPLAPIGEKQP